MSTANDIAKLILNRAAQVPGQTWSKIKQGAKLYTTGYAQNLVDIAQALADGDITQDEAKINAENAELLLAMGVANAQEVTLNEVQKFFDDVINILKGAINSKLPIAVL